MALSLVMAPTMNLITAAASAKPTNINPTPSSSDVVNKEMMTLNGVSVGQPQHVVCDLATTGEAAVVVAAAGTDLTQDKDNTKKRLATCSSISSPEPSSKRQRMAPNKKRSVRFLPDATDASRVHTQVRTFAIDYDKADLWWTDQESREHMERQSSLLELYFNSCQDLVDSVMLVWVHCAEQALEDGNYCMTMEQRQELALKVAHSPVRGFEKELANELITEQRLKTVGGILELQQMCKDNDTVTPQEKIEAIAKASEAFSQTAAIFAKTVGQADAQVAKDYCQQQQKQQ